MRLVKSFYHITTNYLKGFSSVPTYTLGRWKIPENQQEVWRRSDMTTEDHCGCDEMREKYLRSVEDIERMIDDINVDGKK
jgi:hypothetical protein